MNSPAPLSDMFRHFTDKRGLSVRVDPGPWNDVAVAALREQLEAPGGFLERLALLVSPGEVCPRLLSPLKLVTVALSVVWPRREDAPPYVLHLTAWPDVAAPLGQARAVAIGFDEPAGYLPVTASMSAALQSASAVLLRDLALRPETSGPAHVG